MTQANTTTDTVSIPLPKYIDLAKWENAPETHITWHGTVLLSDLKRLYDLEDNQTAKNQNNQLTIAIEFFQKNAVIWAKFRTQGVLWQTCQRCLEPMAISLDYDNILAVLKDESETTLIDEDTDFVMLDELPHDSGSAKKLLLLPFIEDELLVQLPLSPKHDDCEMAVIEVGEFEEVVQDNPFAMLASLKGQLTS